MRVESGDHATFSTLSLPSVSRRASPPSAGMIQRFPGVLSSLPRLETNASQRPSGDQRGEPSRFSPAVNLTGSEEPSSGAIQIALRYSLESLSIHQVTYATRVPSGEMRGSPAPPSS